MKENALHAVSFIAVLGLAGVAWSQSSQIDRLDEQVGQLQAQVTGEGATITAAPAVVQSGEVRANAELIKKARSAPAEDAEAPNQPSAEAVRRAEAAGLDINDPETRMQLRDVIQEEQEYLREQRWAKRQERSEERIRERMKEVAQETGIDDAVGMQVEDALVVELAEVTEIFRKAREDGDWDGLREKISEVRTETDSQVKGLLDEDEFGAYEKMREQDNRGPWGRGRGGGDRNRDRGQNGEDGRSR